MHSCICSCIFVEAKLRNPQCNFQVNLAIYEHASISHSSAWTWPPPVGPGPESVVFFAFFVGES